MPFINTGCLASFHLDLALSEGSLYIISLYNKDCSISCEVVFREHSFFDAIAILTVNRADFRLYAAERYEWVLFARCAPIVDNAESLGVHVARKVAHAPNFGRTGPALYRSLIYGTARVSNTAIFVN